MSEEIESIASLPDGQGSDGAKAAGALIKKAREDMGVHIGALAVALKVPVRKLEALEAGELATLSGPVFVRALAASVCRHLKMDPAQVLAVLPQVVSVPFSQPPELKTPFRVPGESTGPSSAAQFLTKPVLAVLVLLVGALLVAFWPTHESSTEAEPVAQNPAREMQVLPNANTASEPVATTASQLTVQSTSASLVVPSSALSAPVPTGAKVNPVSAPVPLAKTSAAQGSLPTAAAIAPPANAVSAPAPIVKVSAGPAVGGETGILQFKAKDQSWIEVVDAKGDAVLRRTLAAGELANVNGVLPLRVIVGRIDATEVRVRGRKLDMTTISKDNVGRFEVGQ